MTASGYMGCVAVSSRHPCLMLLSLLIIPWLLMMCIMAHGMVYTMLALCSSLREYEHTKHQYVAMHTLWTSACSTHCYYHYYHPSANILLTMSRSCSRDMEVWILALIICGCCRSLLSLCSRTASLRTASSVPCSYSADLFRVVTPDCIHGSDPASAECGHSIDRGYSHPEALGVAYRWSPVPGTLSALLSQRYYLAVARGLAGLPIPRPTS